MNRIVTDGVESARELMGGDAGMHDCSPQDQRRDAFSGEVLGGTK